MLSPEFIGGLAVGEGCFCISVRRAMTRKGTRVLSLIPSFQISMRDEETIRLVAEALKFYGIAHYTIKRRKQDGVFAISTSGLKRMSKLLPWILPHLTGDKKRAAEHCYEYVQYRLSLPHKSPVTTKDLDYLFKARSLNGIQGQKPRAIEAEHLSRILRDSTPDAITAKI